MREPASRPDMRPYGGGFGGCFELGLIVAVVVISLLVARWAG